MVLPLIPAWQRQAECQAKEGCTQRPPCLYHSWDIGQFSVCHLKGEGLNHSKGKQDHRSTEMSASLGA